MTFFLLERRPVQIMSFLPKIIPYVLILLLLNYSLSLNFSSSAYCTGIINLAIPISLINIATLLSLIDKRDNPTTNKFILLPMSTTLSHLSLDHKGKNCSKKASSNKAQLKICYAKARVRKQLFRDKL